MACCAWASTKSDSSCPRRCRTGGSLQLATSPHCARFRYRRERRQAACACPCRWRVGKDRRGRSAHDRRGISDWGRFCRTLARHGCKLRWRTRRRQALRAGVPQMPPSGLEFCRAREFQSRREQERRERAVCVPGDLYDTSFGGGQGPAYAARQGFEGICGSEEPRAPAVAADAGPARRRAMRLAQDDGRCRARSFIRCVGARDERCNS